MLPNEDDNDEVVEVVDMGAEDDETEETNGGCGRVNDNADIGVVGLLVVAAVDVEGNVDGFTVPGCVDVGGIGFRVV